MENEKEIITSIYDIASYRKTIPFHAHYNIVIWPFIAYLYLGQIKISNLWIGPFLLGLSWSILTIVIDLFGWVLIKHPWRMTFKEMYIDYQPWISLIYLSILVSPLIAAIFVS
jgi:hypothetical protein